jgi:hypothetical protein
MFIFCNIINQTYSFSWNRRACLPLLASIRLITPQALLIHITTNMYHSSWRPHLCGDGLYLKPLVSFLKPKPITIESLNCIHTVLFRQVRTWLRIVSIYNLLTLPTSFPLGATGQTFRLLSGSYNLNVSPHKQQQSDLLPREFPAIW